MNIKLLICVIIISISQSSCSQKNDNKKTEKMITRNQYNNISKEVKTFEYNPRYSFNFKSTCSFEVYVNDVLVYYSFSSGTKTGVVFFSQYILKTGKQQIRIKLLPEANANGEIKKQITKADIADFNFFHEQFGLFKETPVLKLSLPRIQDDVPMLEIKGEFLAEVPYVLDGWSKGVDLSKEDSKKLEKEVLEKYNQFINALENKDVATIATIIYKREKEIAQSLFLVSGKEGSYDKGWEELEMNANEIEKIQPIDNYEMRIFGNGKIVALLKKDIKLKNFPAIIGETEDELVFYGLLLYRPALGIPLEVIR